MNAKAVTGIVVIIAGAILVWWYWYEMPHPGKLGPEIQLPEDSVNGVAAPDDQVSAKLAGTWKSSEDAKFTREFDTDGTVTDRYDGSPDASTSGSWSFVTDFSQEPASLPKVKDAKVLKLEFPQETLYFALLGVTDTDLNLSYLDRGNTLSFTRVK